MAILIIAELRRRFAVPLESLTWIKSFMLQEGADHFAYVVRMMQCGLTVYLLTDFKETFIMDTDLEFEDYFKYGCFRGDEPSVYIFIRINPLVNRLLSCLKNPIQLETREETYDLLCRIRREPTARNQQEYEVLRLIREKAYQRVSVHVSEGKIIRLEVDEELPLGEQEKREKIILDAIRNNDFQTVTVQVQNGKVVRLSRKNSIKPKR